MRLPAPVLDAGPVELRRWRPAVVEAVLDAVALSQTELAQWLPWADPMPTPEAELAALTQGEADFDAGVAFHYAIFETSTGELVGGASLQPTPGSHTIEIGYWVRSDRTGRGYATAAARALTAAAFAEVGLDRVEIHMDRANAASAAVPPKLGYLLINDGQAREVVARGHTGVGLVWEMTRDRWHSLATRRATSEYT